MKLTLLLPRAEGDMSRNQQHQRSAHGLKASLWAHGQGGGAEEWHRRGRVIVHLCPRQHHAGSSRDEKQTKCPSMDEGISKMWSIHSREH